MCQTKWILPTWGKEREGSKMFSNQKVIARPWTLYHSLLSWVKGDVFTLGSAHPPSWLCQQGRTEMPAWSLSPHVFCLHAFPSQPCACFHEEDGHSWMGPALSSPCFLLDFPCASTMPCSWANFWWLTTGGKQSSDTLCCLKAPGSERKRGGGGGSDLDWRRGKRVLMPAPFLNNHYM